ncbi:MAG TPA: hypothetical protein VGD56_13605, partial [Gemmatirosa sp.]
MQTPRASARGSAGLTALRSYMAGRAPAGPGDGPVDFVVDANEDYADDFTAAVLAAYPELGAYAADVAPPGELQALWLRRREREFGRYLSAPMLPALHPLRDGTRGGPPAGDTIDIDARGSDAPPGARPGPPRVQPLYAWRGHAPLFKTCDRLTAGHAPPIITTAAPAGIAAASAAGVPPRQRFHVGDLLSVVMDRMVSPRGYRGALALLRYMADQPTADEPWADTDAFARYAGDFRAALLAAHPALGAFGKDDEPPEELRPVWLRRREREF